MMAASFLVLAGCQHFDRARECRALADGVNPELKQLSINYTDHGAISAEELSQASQMYAKAAARLEETYFKEPETAGLASQMKENLKAIARSCDRLALKFKQAEPADPTARNELETQHQRHASLVASIDRTCHE
jgi:hypothetical protein